MFWISIGSTVVMLTCVVFLAVLLVVGSGRAATVTIMDCRNTGYVSVGDCLSSGYGKPVGWSPPSGTIVIPPDGSPVLY